MQTMCLIVEVNQKTLRIQNTKESINAAILAKPNWDVRSIWSRHVATPDGWTFVIPTYQILHLMIIVWDIVITQ